MLQYNKRRINMDKKNYEYSDKPLIQRLIFLAVGISNFFVGFALYYLFKDDKSKKWQIIFIQRGAIIGLELAIIDVIFAIIEWITTGKFSLGWF